MPPLLSLRDVTLGFGGPPLLDAVSLDIDDGDRVCLLGRNGVGKSTLMRLIAGEHEPESGEVALLKPGMLVARLIQEVPADLAGCNFRIVAGGLGAAGELLGELHDLGLAPDAPDAGARIAALEQRATEEDLWALQRPIEKALARLDLDPDVESSTQSSGLKRRVLFARAIVREPDLLLLDEPTNHLDITSIGRLEELVVGLGATLLFTTHDRTFLRRLATRIADLDRGKIQVYDCGYATFLERKQARLDVEAKADAAFDKKLAEEEVWIRKGVRERRTRNEGRVRELMKMREERRDRRSKVGVAKLEVQEAERSGRVVIEAKGVGFGWEADAPVVSGLSSLILRGDRIGIIGPNGSGKTTLLRLLLKQLEPDAGTVRHGTNLEVAYFDQLRETLDESKSVADNVTGGGDYVSVGGAKRHIVGYLGDFLFTGERVRAPIDRLSGGERNRLLLARLFTRPSNVLVLDEPTNDLDLETMELLEERLLAYAGTVLLVSHDRAFLDGVVTSTMVLEGDGRVGEYVGGYEDWLRQRPPPPEVATKSKAKPTAKVSTDAAKPRKITFKEQKELDALPARIEELEARQAELYERMADPELLRDGAAVVEAKDELARVVEELATVYARWEELEGLRSG